MIPIPREYGTAFESYFKSDTTPARSSDRPLDRFRKALYKAILYRPALADANPWPNFHVSCVDLSGPNSHEANRLADYSKPGSPEQHTNDPKHCATDDERLLQPGCWKLFGDKGSNHLPTLNFQMVNRLALAADMYDAAMDAATKEDHQLASAPCSRESRMSVLLFDRVYMLVHWPPLVERSSCNWTHQTSYEWKDVLLLCVITCITGGYGGLHALAWHSHFPTVTEQLLWQTSSLVIAASGILATFSNVVAFKYRRSHWGGFWLRLTGQPLHVRLLIGLIETFFDLLVHPSSSYLNHTKEELDGSLLKYVRPIIGWMCVAIFVSARVFIVIEVYISLRSLPESAYRTPDWPNWIPHL